MGAQRLGRILWLAGFAFLIVAVSLPVQIENMRYHPPLFTAGFESLQTVMEHIAANVSIVSSIVVAALILVLERPTHALSNKPLSLGIITLLIFCAEITYSLYLSVIRPLTGTVATYLEVYLSLSLVPVGLAFALFTLASIVSSS